MPLYPVCVHEGVGDDDDNGTSEVKVEEGEEEEVS
jgi:hypothetical protein